MANEKPQGPSGQPERKGLVTEVVVPIVQSGVAGYVGAKVGGGKKPPDPPKKVS